MAVVLPLTSPSFLSVPVLTSSVSSAAPPAVIFSALSVPSVPEIVAVTAAMVALVLFEVDGQKDETTIIPILVLNEKDVLLNDIFGGVSAGYDDPDNHDSDSGDDDTEGNDDDDAHDDSDGGDSVEGEGDGEDDGSDEENSSDGDDGNDDGDGGDEEEEDEDEEDDEENDQDNDANNSQEAYTAMDVDSDGEPIWMGEDDPRPRADPNLNARVNKLLNERADSIFQAQCFILMATETGDERPKMVILAEQKGVFDDLLHGAPYTNETLNGLLPVLLIAAKATSKALWKLPFIFEEVGDDYVPNVGFELEPLCSFAKCMANANNEHICVCCEKNKVKRSALPCSHWFICERCSRDTKADDPLYPDHCLICGKMITGWDLHF